MLKRAWLWILGLFEDSNGVPDEARVGAMIIICIYCWNSYQSVLLSAAHAFDMQAFGLGGGALAAGLGMWLGLRKDN